MHERKSSVFILSGFVLFFILFLSLSFALARTKTTGTNTEPSFSLHKPLAAEPCSQQRTHRVAKYCLTLTNWGFFGSGSREEAESEGGCFNPKFPLQYPKAPSFDFPCGSDLEYLFQGALWVGAVVEGETLVSVGADGWERINEMYPATEGQGGCIKEKSTRVSTPNCNPPDTAGAISEQDIIAIYSDTGTVNAPMDPNDNRPHRPIGIQVEQRSYSWSYDYAEDFALIDFTIKNIGKKDIKGIWIGLYIDADVATVKLGAAGSQDDIAGFRKTYPSPLCMPPLCPDTMAYQDTINIAWIADNDGDLNKRGAVTDTSVTSVTGVKVVRAPTKQISFNWWLSWGYSPLTLDWGPQLQKNWDLWVENYGAWCSGEGQTGTPCGDKAKYYIMSNQEFDYDEIFACLDHTADGWLPKSDSCFTLANGYDTRYLFSFGPISFLGVGDSTKVTVAYVAGENFHTKLNPIDPNNPKVYYNNLDFSDFATNAVWSSWVYDNPGVDTDSLTDPGHYKGKCYKDRTADTCLFYYEGDSIPDFKGPPPPTPPFLSFDNGDGYIKVKWNGRKTEETPDQFTGVRDFEGYRIYMSYTGLANDWMLLASYDFIDYKMWKLKSKAVGYDTVWLDEGIRPHTIEKYFGKALRDTLEKNPNKYTASNPWVYTVTETTIYINWYEIKKGDQLFFASQDWNRNIRDLKVNKAYVDSVNNVNTDSIETNDIPDSLIRDEYYECEYTQEGFLPSSPVWVSVTAFDFGDAKTKLGEKTGGLESAKSITAKMVFALDSPSKAQESRKKVVVVPNPYKISENYRFPNGLEKGGGQFDKRISFYNLPAKCTIRIYTLDGDLVKEIKHNDPSSSYGSWNLINENTQAVVSGIYLYSVESESGNQIGKFVIIK